MVWRSVDLISFRISSIALEMKADSPISCRWNPLIRSSRVRWKRVSMIEGPDISNRAVEGNGDLGLLDFRGIASGLASRLNLYGRREKLYLAAGQGLSQFMSEIGEIAGWRLKLEGDDRQQRGSYCLRGTKLNLDHMMFYLSF